MRFSTGLGRNLYKYGDLVWMSIMPDGIRLLDRLENKIFVLDHRLNLTQTINFNLKIFPEKAVSGPWGRIFLYSKTLNNIYVFENGVLENFPFINLFKDFNNNLCVEDMAINGEGEFGILDCSGTLILFTQNGQKNISYPSSIENGKFLISVQSDWFIFNKKGDGFSINNKIISLIPRSSIPILDIVSMNRSLAILSKDHILIMDVE